MPPRKRQIDPTDIDRAIDPSKAVALVADSARIKSYSGDEADIAQFMAEKMTELGLDVRLQEIAPRRFNAIGVWRGSDDGPSFMYNGHMDTNPAGEGWTRDPLGGECDDAFVYGIGVSNMKAGNGSFLHALQALKATGFEPKGDLVTAFVVGELQGGVGTVRLLESGVRTDFFVVGEPTELTLLTRHAASYAFEIWVYGKTRHLSKAEEGVDALRKMERLLPRLRRLRYSGTRSAADRALDRIHVGVLRAGMTKEFFDWRPQQLADTCVAKCAGRFGPGYDMERALADIETLLETVRREDPDFRAELKPITANRIFMPPFSADTRARPVRVFANAHRDVAGKRPLVGTHTPAKLFGSDAAHLAKAGMTGLLYGPGGTYNTMPDERVAIDEIVAASRVYARAVVDLVG